MVQDFERETENEKKNIVIWYLLIASTVIFLFFKLMKRFCKSNISFRIIKQSLLKESRIIPKKHLQNN